MALSTAKGIATAESVTYLNSMMTELGKSGTVVSDLLKNKTGQSFDQLMGSGMNLAEVLNIIDAEAKANGKSMADMFGSAEAGRIALILASENGAEFNKMLQEMQNSTGATDTAFKKMDETLKSRIDKSVQKVKLSFLKLGEALLPLLENKIIPAVENFVDWISNLDEETMNNLASTTMWTAGLGLAFIAIGKLIGGLSSVVSGISGMAQMMGIAGGATSTASAAIGGLGTATLGLTGILTGGVVLAIGALGGYLFKLGKDANEGTIAFNNLGKGIDDFSGRVKTNDSIWSSIFGKEYEFKLSQQFQEQKEGVFKQSDEIIAICEDTHRRIEEILNTDLSTVEKNNKIREAYEQEINNLTAKWEEYNKIDDSHQVTNGQRYMQYLTELGVEDYNFRSQQLAQYNEYFDSQQQQISDNENQIIEIKKLAYAEIRELTDEEQETINGLIEENKEIRTNLVDMEGQDVWTVLDKWNLEKKALYGADAYEHTLAELEKRKALQESTASMKDSIDEQIKKVNQRTDIDSTAKFKIIENLNAQKAEYTLFEDVVLSVLDRAMKSGSSYEDALSEALGGVASAMDDGRFNAEQYGMTNVQVWENIINKLAEGGASVDELTQTILKVPQDIKPQVMANVQGKNEVDNLKYAIDQVKSKDVYVNTYSTTYGIMKNPVEVSYYKGSEGTLPKRAYGEENFFKTQRALVGEQGAEMVELPRGAKVKTHRKTRENIGGEGQQPIQVAVQVDGRTIANAIAKYIGETVAQNNRRTGFGGAF